MEGASSICHGPIYQQHRKKKGLVAGSKRESSCVLGATETTIWDNDHTHLEKARRGYRNLQLQCEGCAEEGHEEKRRDPGGGFELPRILEADSPRPDGRLSPRC